MSESKLLDVNGLDHFWQRIKENYWKGTAQEFSELTTTLRPGTIVHITDDYDEATTVVTSATQDANSNLVFDLSDGSEIVIGGAGSYNQGIIYQGTINQVGDSSNVYNCKVIYVKYGAVVTIYFDIETNYGLTNFSFENVLPESCRPYNKITTLVAESVDNFNNIVINTDGTISCSSINGSYNIKTAVTYVMVATQ